MRVVRVIGAVTTVACALLLVQILSIQPYRSNILKRRVEQQFEGLYVAAAGPVPSIKAIRTARENVGEIRNAMRYVPNDVDLYLELAAHYGLLGQPDRQIATYEQLLTFHRRPEIFHNLAVTEFETGRLDRAVENFSHAVAFDYLYIHQVPEALKERVIRRAEQIDADLAVKLTPR